MTRKEELIQAILKAIRNPVTNDLEIQRTLIVLVMKLFDIRNPEELVYGINEDKVSVIDKVLALLRPGLKQYELDVKALSDRIDKIELETVLYTVTEENKIKTQIYYLIAAAKLDKTTATQKIEQNLLELIFKHKK